MRTEPNGTLRDVLARLTRASGEAEEARRQDIDRCHASRQESARNLVRAAAVLEAESGADREAFHRAGLLAPSERLEEVSGHLAALRRFTGGELPEEAPESPSSQAEDGSAALLGPARPGRSTRIMVTLGRDALADPGGVGRLVAGGMDLVRINCARDDASTWEQLAALVRRFAPERGCRVLMDLPGPKLRVSWLGGKDRLRLRAGDHLELLLHGRAAHETPRAPSVVGVSAPEALRALGPGHPVWFDDGKIGGVVERTDSGAALVRITFPSSGQRSLRLERSLNLPLTPVEMPALTPETRTALACATRHADLAALSFVRSAADVHALLDAPGMAEVPGVVVKIENARAVGELLPVLLALLRVPRGGVLLARGDLAVECGFEALPFIQERLLALCRAAHLPLFIATGILERMSRKGRPSRAAVLDAFHAGRAQCVMLNRGAHVQEALTALDALLRRREAALSGPAPHLSHSDREGAA